MNEKIEAAAEWLRKMGTYTAHGDPPKKAFWEGLKHLGEALAEVAAQRKLLAMATTFTVRERGTGAQVIRVKRVNFGSGAGRWRALVGRETLCADGSLTTLYGPSDTYKTRGEAIALAEKRRDEG